MSNSSLETFLLTPTEPNLEQYSGDLKDLCKLFLEADYEKIIKSSEIKEFLTFDLPSTFTIKDILENIPKTIKKHEADSEYLNCCFFIAVSSFLAFTQENWTGPSLKFDFRDIFDGSLEQDEKDIQKHCLSLLNVHGEYAYRLTSKPSFLVLAKTIMNELKEKLETWCWWIARINLSHQSVLSNNVQQLHDITYESMTKLIESDWMQTQSKEITALAHIEYMRTCHQYEDDKHAKIYLSKAREICKLNMQMTGVLGKRTKYQNKLVSQLTLLIDNDDAPLTEAGPTAPQNYELDDDTILPKIAYAKDLNFSKLSHVDQIIILASCLNVKNSNPQDGLTSDEMFPYVNRVLEEKDNSNWMICSLALLLRSRLEKHKMRQVERATLQVQALSDQYENLRFEDGPVADRIKYIFALSFPPKHILQRELGHMFLSIGSSRSARDIFEALEMWADVITSLHAAGEEEKCLRLIEERILIDDNPDLHCVKGDLTGDLEEYKKAWDMSDGHCTRAMRSLGNHYLNAKDYQNAIDSYQKALAINPIFHGTWFSLSCSAMALENWSLAATSMRQSLRLEVDNSEGWNNLGAILLRLDEVEKAQRAFLEGIRFNYSSWRIWENLLHTSIMLEDISNSIQAIKQIVELQHKFTDTVKLIKLVELMITKLEKIQIGTPEFTSNADKMTQVLACVTAKTSTDPLLWSVCARWQGFLGNQDKELDYLQKAYRSSQVVGWEHDTEAFNKMGKYALQLAKAYCIFNTKTHAHKGRLLLRGIVKKAEDMQSDTEIFKSLQSQLEICSELEDKLKALTAA